MSNDQQIQRAIEARAMSHAGVSYEGLGPTGPIYSSHSLYKLQNREMRMEAFLAGAEYGRRVGKAEERASLLFDERSLALAKAELAALLAEGPETEKPRVPIQVNEEVPSGEVWVVQDGRVVSKIIDLGPETGGRDELPRCKHGVAFQDCYECYPVSSRFADIANGRD